MGERHTFTDAAMSALKLMAEHEHDPAGEMIWEGRQVWIGDLQTTPYVASILLNYCTIRDVSDVKGPLHRFVINDTGKAIIRRPELANEVRQAILACQPFTIENNRIVPMPRDEAPAQPKERE